MTNERDARVSIHHCAAVSFLFGKAGLREFSDEMVRDPAVAALRALTTVRLDSNSPKGAATATVRTLDGRTLEETVLQAGAITNSHCLTRNSRRRCENSLGMAPSQGVSMMSSRPPGNSTCWELSIR